MKVTFIISKRSRRGFVGRNGVRALVLALVAGAGIGTVVACSDDEATPSGPSTTTPGDGGTSSPGPVDGSIVTPVVDAAADAGDGGPKPIVLPLPQTGHARLLGVTYGADGSLYGFGQAGATGNPADLALLLVKILPSGQLDTTFNGTGYVVQNLATGLAGEIYRGITIQTQGANAGKIVVAGVGEHDQTDAAAATRDVIVARFNTNGTLDDTFGSGGVQRFPLGDGTGVQQWGLNHYANDDLIVTGTRAPLATDFDASAVLPARELVVMKLDGATGALVSSFGQDSDGVWRLPFPWNVNPRTATLLSDGSAIIAGYRNAGASGPPNRPVISKLTPAGVLDPTFGTGGVFFSENEPAGFGAGAIIEAYGAVPQGTKFVTTGYGKEAATNIAEGWVTLRLFDDGGLDDAYGNGGHAFFPVNDQNANSRFVFVLPDDRVVLLGGASPPKVGADTMPQHAAMIVLEANGKPDPTFSAPGPKLFDLGGPATGRANHFFWSGAVSPDHTRFAVVGIKGGVLANPDAGVTAGVDQAVVMFVPTGQ